MRSIPAFRRSRARSLARSVWKGGLLAAVLIPLLGASCRPKTADLAMRILSAPSSAPFATGFDVSVEVCNEGRAVADPTLASLTLNPADELEPDVPLGSFPVPDLAIGACHAETLFVEAPFGPPAGAFLLVALAEPVATEKLEVNNTDVREIGLGWGPDLVVQDVTAQPAAMPGAPLQVEAEVCNQGTDWSGPSLLAVVLSLDDVIALDGVPDPDWLAGNLNVPDLGAGACASLADTVDAPTPEGVFTVGGIVDHTDQVWELIQTNNAGAGSPIAIGYGPDLVVSSISGPPSALPWSSFEAQLEVCNQGTTPSDPTTVAVHLSEDAVITPALPVPEGGDPQLGSFAVPWLDAGQCAAQDVMVDASVPEDGAYFLGAFVDETEQVLELFEDNNGRAGTLMGVGSAPDYVVAAIEAPASAVDSFDAEVRVCNQGTAPGSPFMLQLFLSQDTVLAPMPEGEDPEAGNAPVGGLPPGLCEDVPVAGWVAPPAGTGPYHLIAYVDQPDDAAELIETNNQLWGPVMGIGSDPDLVVTDVQGPPSAFPFSNFDGSATVCNQGTMPSPTSSVAFYLSEDTHIQGPSPGAPPDAWAGELPVPDLFPGACATVAGTLQAGVSPDGAYYLGAVVDDPDSVVELIETNNARAGGLMGVGAGPDLTIASIDGPPSAFPGSDVDVTFEVCNVGTLPAPPSQLDLHVSSDAVIEGGYGPPIPPDPPVGNVPLPPLDPGACHLGGLTVWLPPEPSGAVWLGGIVDEPEAVDELVESNNALAGSVIGVGSAPDYIVAILDVPPSSPPVGPLPVTVEVCNQGTMPGAPVDVALFFSEDDELDGSLALPGLDPFLDAFPVPPLVPGACHVEVRSTSPSVPDGAWHVLAVVDPDDWEPELREDNNLGLAGPVGLGTGPDLVIASLAAPPVVASGFLFTVDFEVCNQGTAAAPDTLLHVYHSQDRVVTSYVENPATPDVYLDVFPVPPLPPGACDAQTVDVWTWVPAGPWHVGGFVDQDDFVGELIESNNTGVAPVHDVTP